MGAGYFANSQAGIGYPLRMSYTLFPLVFLYVTGFFENITPARKRLFFGAGYCALHYGFSLLGVLLDPGRSHFRTTDVIKATKEFFQ